jgi:hypothetical protein
MAWEWSHTTEAYADAQAQVERMPREWLIVVFAEWEAKSDPSRVSGGFSQRKYKRALGRAKGRGKNGGLPDDILASHIWDKMSEQATCTNGGHKAWACPFGCEPHLVPFTDPEVEAEERRQAADDAAWEAEADAMGEEE